MIPILNVGEAVVTAPIHPPRRTAVLPPPAPGRYMHNVLNTDRNLASNTLSENAAPNLANANPQVNLSWIGNPAISQNRHLFTASMVQYLSCGYCHAQLNSLADLRYHLSHTGRHQVFACCGKFFRREVDYERHRAMAAREHRYVIVRR